MSPKKTSLRYQNFPPEIIQRILRFLHLSTLLTYRTVSNNSKDNADILIREKLNNEFPIDCKQKPDNYSNLQFYKKLITTKKNIESNFPGALEKESENLSIMSLYQTKRALVELFDDSYNSTLPGLRKNFCVTLFL